MLSRLSAAPIDAQRGVTESVIPRAQLSTEKDLWRFLRPRLRGNWSRLEAVTPDGLADTLGLWQGKTWWLELKVGPVSLDALRASQRRFALNCKAAGVPYFVAFATSSGDVRFFSYLDLSRPVLPPFLRQPDRRASRQPIPFGRFSARSSASGEDADAPRPRCSGARPVR